jgi:sulfoxide reductase heme-binding subunit YedZ
MLTLIFLLATLAVTPLRKIFAINGLVRFRRMLGLFAFFYGSLHFITYIGFDRGFDLRSTVKDIAQRPFIAMGMAAFLLILPLAITSTNRMVKRLGGKRWARLHQAVYIAGVAAAIHYWMFVKSDTRLPITVAFVLALLLGYRLFLKFYPPNARATRTTIVPR